MPNPMPSTNEELTTIKLARLSTHESQAYGAHVLADGDVLATALLSLVLFVLLGPQLVNLGAPGLAIAQVTCFALPALAISRMRTERFAAVGLVAFAGLTLIGTVLIATTLWIWLVHWIAPIGMQWASAEQNAALEATFALPSRPLWQSLLFFAIVPAICEELLHRGLILPALSKRIGPGFGLLAGAVLFGLSHFNLARLLPTAVLGFAAGSLRLRTGSLWPAMVLHALYNSSLLVASQVGWFPSAALALPAALGTLAGALLVWQTSPARV